MSTPYAGQPPGQYPQQPGPPPPGYGAPGYGPPPGGVPGPPAGYPPQAGYQQQMPGGYPAPHADAGPQAPPTLPGLGRIVIDTSYTLLAFLLALTGPMITINGQARPMKWGRIPIDLAPGQYHLQIHTRYLWAIGRAEAVIPITEGQNTFVFYRAPALAFMRGAIGPVPQKTPGLVATLIIAAVVWLIAILSVILAVAAA